MRYRRIYSILLVAITTLLSLLVISTSLVIKSPVNIIRKIERNNSLDVKLIPTTVVLDNISNYTTISEDEYYIIKMSPDRNKLNIKYLKDDNCGLIEISHNGNKSVYRIDKSTYIRLGQGNGEYKIRKYVLRNPNVNRAISLGELAITCNNSNSLYSYLGEDYYANYKSTDELFMSTVNKLWAESKSSSEYVKKSFTYVNRMAYDKEKANNIKQNKVFLYRENVSSTLSKMKGICLDKASLLASFLRVKGIPTRLVTGYYYDEYHAWVEAYIDNNWVMMDPTISKGFGNEDKSGYRITAYC